MKLGLGIDIGGTNTKIVAVDEKGGVLAEARFATLPANGPADFVRRLGMAVENFSSGRRFAAAGIGAAGDIDPEKGMIRYSPNLGWREFRLAAAVRRITGLPCFIENDANVAAWGAYAIELKRSCRSVIAVTLGTGVGGGIILDGKLFHGADGTAGEVGHTAVHHNGAPCNCGARGCLEAYCGSGAIMRRAHSLIRDKAAFIKKYAEPGKERLNTVCLKNAADRGNRTARGVWREMGENLAIGMRNLVLVLNPDAIVFTGGVSKASAHFLPPVRELFSRQGIRTPFDSVKLVTAKNADLGAAGAGVFGLDSL